MKLATTTGDYSAFTTSQKTALEHIHEAGFKYADYNFGSDYLFRNGVYSDDYESYFEQIAIVNETSGIKLIQAHAPMGKPLIDGGTLQKDTLRCVDACGKWGIQNLVVHSGYAPGLTVEQNILQNKEFFAPLLERAEKYGVNILVENFNKMYKEDTYWIDNAPDLLRMIETVNHPLFHAVWDAGHANLQEMPQDEALRILGKHVKALHIQDNRGLKDEHLAPFVGTTNWDSVMCGLNDIGYDGYFTFEVGRFFTFGDKRTPYSRSTLLADPPLELRDSFEKYLYSLGKCMLEKYGCFEE